MYIILSYSDVRYGIWRSRGKNRDIINAQGLAFLSLHGSLFKFVFYLTMIQINQIIFERCILEVQNKT